jgi:DNA-directed RNA polymerase
MAAGTTATPAVDTYMVVADRVKAMFGGEERYGHIKPDRSLAKQPTQTYFYGATNIGRSNQIQAVLEERDDVSLDPKEAAKLYYAIGEDHRKAIEDLFPGAKETMEFLREMARALAKHGEPLQWTTPTGFPLINRYQKDEYKTVNSTLRGVRVRRKITVGSKPAIRVGKSKSAVAANVIHALDAAHMMLTANACNAAGIDIMGIHDCYICLAPQAEDLDKTIKHEFVRMYEGCDPLTEIRDQACSRAASNKLRAKGKHVAAATGIATPTFPEVPKLGTFDLREILTNVYIFS